MAKEPTKPKKALGKAQEKVGKKLDKKVQENEAKILRQAARATRKRVRRDPEEARAHILAAAQAVFAERGPDRVGLKEVARAAGVSHALVSHYFGTFDALVESALEAHAITVRQGFLDRLAEMAEHGGADVETLIDRFFEAVSNPLYGRLVAWALLTGRMHSLDFFPRRHKGLKAVAEAIEASSRQSAQPISRDNLDFALVLVIAAGFGYAIGGGTFWDSLGEKQTAERDAAFRQNLAHVIRTHLFGGARVAPVERTSGSVGNDR